MSNFTSSISDQKVLELFRQYEENIVKELKEYFKENGYVPNKEYDEEGLWDEMFCMMNGRDFVESILDSLENSIGPESYGFDCVMKEEEVDK